MGEQEEEVLGVEAEVVECKRSVGSLADNRNCSRWGHKQMDKESGTRVGLALCNKLKHYKKTKKTQN